MKILSPSKRSKRGSTAGFTLLEIIFAMALFVMVAVGLMGALNEIGLASLESGESARLTRMLRSHLTEVTREGILRPGEFETEADEQGIRLRTIIEELSMQSEQGVDLPEMYRVEVSAVQGSGREALDRAEIWVYRPLYAPR
jgi:type II secretory pathway component PulJ